MAERWVLNVSPLIVLARPGYEGLFFELADQVVIPRAASPFVREALARTVGEKWPA